jgi:demethylmenaquinone methyltransferase/2-methoxy-6-polyprenyl-1,4-benzoquinol methylase
MEGSKNITPYKNSPLSKKEQVTQMFDNISENYDGLNRVISFGIDKKWRRKVVKLVGDTRPENVLDIATGTGDLALMLAQTTTAFEVVGLDLSPGMLEIGRKKIAATNVAHKIELVLGDSENLPFSEKTFDAVTVAFGIRNFENLEQGLNEIMRVLRPGGILVILETSNPVKTPYKQGYVFYNKYILPLIGKLFSKDNSAYGYLSKSASVFPFGEELNNILTEIGFIEAEAMPQTFGVATIYSAFKN